MREPIINDITSYKHCDCGSVATKEITIREFPMDLVVKKYCPMCFDKWKGEQYSAEDSMKWAREKLISKGMSEEEVDKALKEIYKK